MYIVVIMHVIVMIHFDSYYYSHCNDADYYAYYCYAYYCYDAY